MSVLLQIMYKLEDMLGSWNKLSNGIFLTNLHISIHFEEKKKKNQNNEIMFGYRKQKIRPRIRVKRDEIKQIS